MHAAAVDQSREVARSHCRAQHAQVGLADADHRFLARPLEDGVDVVAERESLDEERRAGTEIDAVDETPRLVDRMVPTVEVDVAPVHGDGHARRAGFRGHDSVARVVRQCFDRAGELRIDGPQRREVPHERRVARQHEAARRVVGGLSGGCGHRPRAVASPRFRGRTFSCYRTDRSPSMRTRNGGEVFPMSDLLLDVPWWMIAGLAGLGAFVFVSGNRRQETKVRNAGVAIVAMAIAWAVLSYYVDTPVEMTSRRSREFVKSVVDKNWPVTTSILDPAASLSVLDSGNAVYTTRDQILDGAKQAVDRYGLKSATIFSLGARRDDSLITVDLDIISDQDATMGRQINTSWQFEWQQTGDDWRLLRI